MEDAWLASDRGHLGTLGSGIAHLEVSTALEGETVQAALARSQESLIKHSPVMANWSRSKWGVEWTASGCTCHNPPTPTTLTVEVMESSPLSGSWIIIPQTQRCAICSVPCTLSPSRLRDHLVVLWTKTSKPRFRLSVHFEGKFPPKRITAVIWKGKSICALVLCPNLNPPQRLDDTFLRLSKEHLDRKFPSEEAESKIMALSKGACNDAFCTGPSGHSLPCVHHHSLSLPPELYNLVTTLRISTDLFASSVSRCGADGVLNWFSKDPKDKWAPRVMPLMQTGRV